LVGSIAAEDEEIKIGLESHHHIHDEGRLLSLLERIRRRFRKPIINKESIRIVTGFYDVNDVDWIPVQDQVGPEGLYVSYATSGHGFKLAFPMSELLLSQIDGCPKPRALANIETSIFNLNNKRINAGGVLA
jgi:glycine/D-amino acid oxidase-like deaminating enzyme